MKERLIGIVVLIVGGILGYLCIYQPLESAWANAPTVSVSLKGALVVPICLLAGLMFLVVGPRASSIVGTREKPSPVTWAITIVGGALGIGLYIWLRSTLQAHGYDFQGKF